MPRLSFQVDPKSPVPLHAQIAEHIQLAVARGSLAPGDQLPTVRQLSVDLKVNSNTVARVYAQLESASVLETFRGRGTFVRERPQVSSQTRGRRLESLCRGFVGACAREGYSVVEIQDALSQLREGS